MPVDLEAYKSVMGAALKSQGYACVFIATTTEGNPCRLNYATDLLGAFKRLRRTSPAQLVIEEVVWLPDRGMAMVVSDSVRDDLEAHLAGGGWLNLPAPEVAQAVRSATARHHPHVMAFTHDQLMLQWTKAHPQRERKRSRPSKSARQAAKLSEARTA
jgi:hypothetical protein